MIEVGNLELHVTHSCNLACESCSHYSNHGHKGNLAPQTADQWMKLWNRRISPRFFSLLGGEPTIHPQMVDIVELACINWPSAQIRLVSNGFFLDRHPTLPLLMKREPRIRLDISIHHDSPEYEAKLGEVRMHLAQWVRDHDISYRLSPSYGRWTRRYKGHGSDMQPYEDNNPQASWDHCSARSCKQLLDGKIWKCAPLAYLPMQNAKYPLSDQWKPYLAYQPLDPGCSDAEMAEFLRRKAESACGMCPAKPERFDLPNPMRGPVQVTVDKRA